MSVRVQVNSDDWKLIAAVSTEHGCCSVPTAIRVNNTCDESSRQHVRDLVKGDYIDRLLPQVFSRSAEAVMTTAQLEQTLRDDLRDTGGGKLANFMVTHFMNGTGQMIEHPNRSFLSNLASGSPSFQRFAADTLRFIWQGLERANFEAPQGYYEFFFRSQDFGWCEFGDTLRTIYMGVRLNSLGITPEPSQVLRAVIGGTSGFKIFIRRLRIVRGREIGAICELRFEFCDHFGADEDDHYTCGLRALWLLQHAKPGPQKPFCNLIIIEREANLMANSLRLF